MTDATRNPPPVVRAVLGTVHRLVMHQRPYQEVSEALDAAAALPEATEPDAAALIALERLDAVARYPVADVSDEEVERVLQLTEAAVSVMPPAERAWHVGNACRGRPALVLSHLVPLLEGLEQGGLGDSDTLDDVREQISVARGEPQPAEDDDEGEDQDEDDVELAPEELTGGLRYAYRLKRMGWPYEDVIAVLDEVAVLPVSAEYQGWIMRDRLILADMYGRPDDDMERLIEAALGALAGEPAKYRASTISAACSERPALAEKYVPALIAELEEELRQSPDPEGEQVLAGVNRRLARARAGG